MTIPAGYTQDNTGWYWKDDGNGPYSISSGGVATLLAGLSVSASSTNFTEGPQGFYYGSDGSGPYARGPGGIYKLIG